MGENTGMDVREIGWEGVDWMHLAQDRDQWRAVVSTVAYVTPNRTIMSAEWVWKGAAIDYHNFPQGL
jgi:hypothetical protein